MTTTPESPQSGIASFIHEVGQLKNTPRQGWFFLGIKQPESVADHSHRAAVIAFLLAAQSGVDPYRAATLALFHDLPETRTGDLTTPAHRYLNKPDEEQIFTDQAGSLPEPAQQTLMNLMHEYLEQESPESRLARDADKLECLTQAIEYHNQGTNGTQTWQHNSVEALQTPAGRSMAAQLLDNPETHWWSALMTSTTRSRQPTEAACGQKICT